MMLSTLYHLVRRALSNLHKALLINSITTATITIALLLLAGTMMLTENVQRLLQVSEAQLQIKLFLFPKTSEEKLQALSQQIAQLPAIAKVTPLTADAAQQDFLQRHADFRPILEGLGENPFQPMLLLQLQHANELKNNQLMQQLASFDGVESLDYGGRWLDRYITIKGSLQIISTILASLIALACIFLISNTIRLNIFTRQDEIAIFKLVGGTKLFIAAPFLLEGMLLGGFSALLALAILWAIYYFSLPLHQSEIVLLTGGLRLHFLDVKGMLLVLSMAVASGFIGSLVSMRRFLRYHA